MSVLAPAAEHALVAAPIPVGLASGMEAAAAREPIGERLRDFASQQLLLAEAHLLQPTETRHDGVHQARKCLRRARAALAFGRGELGPHAARIDQELARICRGLSPLRDGQALLEALQRFDAEQDTELHAVEPRARALAIVRRDVLLERALAADPAFAKRRQRVLAARKRLLRLDWQALDAADVAKAMKRSVRRMKQARRRAARHPERERDWHDYRRRLRRVRQQDSVLAALAPDLKPVLKNIKERAELLGEAQDDALVLRHCAGASPFPPDLRKILRRVARARLRRVRQARLRGGEPMRPSAARPSSP